MKKSERIATDLLRVARELVGSNFFDKYLTELGRFVLRPPSASFAEMRHTLDMAVQTGELDDGGPLDKRAEKIIKDIDSEMRRIQDIEKDVRELLKIAEKSYDPRNV